MCFVQPRVVGQSQRGERNFHIFFQMCAARDDAELRSLQLAPATDYQYLSATECITVPRVNDL
jgi:myosin-5